MEGTGKGIPTAGSVEVASAGEVMPTGVEVASAGMEIASASEGLHQHLPQAQASSVGVPVADSVEVASAGEGVPAADSVEVASAGEGVPAADGVEVARAGEGVPAADGVEVASAGEGVPAADGVEVASAGEGLPTTDGMEIASAGEGLHQYLPQAQATSVGVPTADGVEMTLAREGLHRDMPQALDAPVLEPPGEREIMSESEEEEDSRRAPTTPPTAGVPVHGGQETDVESDSGLSRSANLLTVTPAENNWVTILCVLPHPKCAKWVYTVMILGGILLARNSRDTEVSAFSQAERQHGCGQDRYCLGAESALRISLAFFIFFMVMFITTVWTKKVHDWRNFWNSNLVAPMFIKISLLVGCLYAVQFTPSPFIQLYGGIARFGAWLFLVIQLITVTRFVMQWNIRQQSFTNRRRWLVQAVAALLNFGSFGAILWLLHDHTSNVVDLAVVSITLILVVLMMCFYLKSEVTTSCLAPGMMIAYTVFMCWTVIKSEPHGDLTKAKDTKGVDWLTIGSFVLMAYSTLSTGEDHEWLQFNEEVPSEDNIPYGFGYFHLVFALGSMYFGMLLVGWNAHKTTERWTIDFGWWSAVVRAVNGLLAAALYIWMLRTPFIWNKTKVVLSWSRASLVPSVYFL